MLSKPDVAKDKRSLSKAGDSAPQLFSVFPNSNNYRDEVSDIACLVPCAINV